MTTFGSNLEAGRLGRHEGPTFLTAAEAVVKGVLESEVPVELLAACREGALGAVWQASREEAAERLLREHGTHVVDGGDASRAMALVLQAARSSRGGIALVPNAELDRSSGAIEEAAAAQLDGRGAMVIMMEDRPEREPNSCPRRAAIRMGLPLIEPGEIADLRDGIELALRLSRAGGRPIGMVVHASILGSADTLTARPNRVVQSVDAMLARRRRRATRYAETGSLLRLARRLELNQMRSIPSPGERVAVGFITIGPAGPAMAHVLHAVGLVGRVPLMQLTLVHPVDESPIERLLGRCERVLVLEPRPGSVEAIVLAQAEAMRRRGERPATVWGRTLPPAEDGSPLSLGLDEAWHPSILARRIIHLLHAIRPTLRVASRLLPDQQPMRVRAAPRGGAVGAPAARAALRQVLGEVEQWLAERIVSEDDGVGPTTLAIDGVCAEPAGRRIVHAEIWDEQSFRIEGVTALRQMAREREPAIMLICDFASEGRNELERFAVGAIPGDSADRIKLEVANFNDRDAMAETLRGAALRDGLTILLVRDGPPAVFDLQQIENGLTEVDRLGFQPRQRLTWPADYGCSIRQQQVDPTAVGDAEAGGRSLVTRFSRERLVEDQQRSLRLSVRLLTEQIDVVRVRPPATRWRRGFVAKLPLPSPIHGQQPLWRAHLAGCRPGGIGLAAHALCEAGRIMGFHVRAIHDATRIQPGRSAWSQVLFTRPSADSSPDPVTAMIPYGEADLLLGLEIEETLRAIDPRGSLRVAFADRTVAVVNVAPFVDDMDAPRHDTLRQQLNHSLQDAAREEHRHVLELAAACRSEFHSDRVVDVAMLGVAFQSGLIPASLEAMEGAMLSLESRGIGRCQEAFAFGRHVAHQREIAPRPRPTAAQSHAVWMKRVVRSISAGGGRSALSTRFNYMIEHTLAQMPGLAETDAGRGAIRDLILGLRSCMTWGGIDYADRFAQLVISLYGADRGDTGRALTRAAILPLGEAMLLRDPVYIATVVTSHEHRRRTRERLDVKTGRGDRLERRFLTQIQVEGFSRRISGEVRTSDWPARVVAMVGRWVPHRWRGSRRARELRAAMIELIQQATAEASANYPTWEAALLQAHDLAVRGELIRASASTVRALRPRSMPAPSLPETPQLVMAQADDVQSPS